MIKYLQYGICETRLTDRFEESIYFIIKIYLKKSFTRVSLRITDQHLICFLLKVVKTVVAKIFGIHKRLDKNNLFIQNLYFLP